jgi:hypothetical protein
MQKVFMPFSLKKKLQAKEEFRDLPARRPRRQPQAGITSFLSRSALSRFAASGTPLNNSGKIESLPFGTGRLA